METRGAQSYRQLALSEVTAYVVSSTVIEAGISRTTGCLSC